jgi:tetratricopeptide (TPR) repeat protein
MIPPPAWGAVDWLEILRSLEECSEEADTRLALWTLHRRFLNWAADHYLDKDEPILSEREPREYRRVSTLEPCLAEVLPQASACLAGPADRHAVLRSALQISGWAEASGYLLVALRFAEAAAACSPADPAPANLAGRLSRTLGLAPLADVWYSRGIALSRTRKWSACYVRGNVGVGTLLKEIGDTKAAVEHYQRAAWRAQRCGIKWLAAEVHHDMLLLALSMRAFADAETYAARALNVYPKHHDRIPALAHDFGLLCTREHAFRFAYPLLRRVLNVITRPHEKLIVWSTLALSAAGSDEHGSYEEGRSAVLELASAFPMSAPPALMNLAFAAHIRRDWSAASNYARDALQLIGNNPVFKEQAHDAVLLLEQVAGRAEATRPRELPDDEEREANIRALCESLSRVLANWHGRTWRMRKEQAQSGAFGHA